jgi:hypothetical protein
MAGALLLEMLRVVPARTPDTLKFGLHEPRSGSSRLGRCGDEVRQNEVVCHVAASADDWHPASAHATGGFASNSRQHCDNVNGPFSSD